MIAELLNTGAENPITGRKLAEQLDCSIRDITALVEEERQAGKAICASNDGKNPGYFLAGTSGDLARYCRSLKGRAIAVFKTRKALLSILKAMEAKEAAAAQEDANTQEVPDEAER